MATVSLQSLLLCAAAVLVLSTSVLASRALQASHDDHEAAQALRVFLPQWMSHSRLHGGSLRWKENSPSGEMYGQDEEDIAADKKYFHDMHNGIFLEMGALDGKTFSNTKFFEETRGWRGLLIEPNPEEFVKLQAERPNAISVNAAICDKKQDVHFVGRRSSESAGAVGGIWEFMSTEFRRRWYGDEDAMPEGATVTSCLPLQSVLKMTGITHIDFVSLDVEGAELKVLETLDFSAVHINVIVIEQDGSRPDKDQAVRKLLAAKGFEMDSSVKGMRAGGRNDWFVNKYFKPSAAPA